MKTPFSTLLSRAISLVTWATLAVTLAVTLAFAMPSCQPKAEAPLSLNPLFTDHMVLQRQSPAAIWGTAAPGVTITATGSWGQSAKAEADGQGHWLLHLETPEAGGPFTLDISTPQQHLGLEDVLVGEVWLAAGQSNMEMPLAGWPPSDTIQNSTQEIAQASNPQIRMFTVARALSAKPETTVEGKWKTCSPETAGQFSATAYFFAKRTHSILDVPVGIIVSSWGGTPAEAWTSKEALRPLGDFNKTLDNMGSPGAKEATAKWFAQYTAQPFPDTDEAWDALDLGNNQAASENFDHTAWPTISLPGLVDNLTGEDLDGIWWLRRTFTLAQAPNGPLTLTIGAVDDMDATYINGQKVGGMAGFGHWNKPRVYTIPKSLLKQGTNTIAIRLIDTGGGGGINGPISVGSPSGEALSLAGTWHHKWVAETYEGKFYNYSLNGNVSQRPTVHKFHANLPTVLYNAMVHPLVPFTLQGAIWYQGETNVGRAAQYQRLFPAMINNWREGWGKPFPFYYVQIAPFNYGSPLQANTSQELREAQRLTLQTPNTGMVVTLDIGNPTNVHPANKQDVGKRLANMALHYTYDRMMMPEGPRLQEVKTQGNGLLVVFNCVGSRLASRSPGGAVKGFELAGADSVFRPATAQITKEGVLVSSPQVTSPVYVRYGWSDAPEASLFGSWGLPVSSFSSLPLQ